MQYYTYQHSDGSDDVAPYKGNTWTSVADAFTDNNDYQIMKARTLASRRGATPSEIQEIESLYK